MSTKLYSNLKLLQLQLNLWVICRYQMINSRWFLPSKNKPYKLDDILSEQAKHQDGVLAD